MKDVLWLWVLAFSVGCSSSPATAPSGSSTAAAANAASSSGPTAAPTTTSAPPGTTSRLDAYFQGSCAPKGSRGGCYSLALNADGTFREILLDASQGGTYVIAGNQLTLTYPEDGPDPQVLTSSDGFKTLSNGYARKP